MVGGACNRAAYIDSSRAITAHQLTFNVGSIADAALPSVPMILAGVCKYSTPLTIDITVVNDIKIGQGHESNESDIR